MIGEIKRHIRDDGPIKVSRSIKELGIKIRELEQIYLNEKGKEISSALKFITNNFIEYEDINDMINKVRNFIIER